MNRQTNGKVGTYVAKSGGQGDVSCKVWWLFSLVVDYKNSAEGVIAPAGAKVTGATIRMWLLNKFISFLAVLTWKIGLKKM